MAGIMTVGEALAEVERLEAAVARCAADEAAKVRDLEEFEAGAAARLVDDPDAADRLTEESVRRRTAVDLARRARETAENRLAEARRGVLVARAGELRAQAAARRAEADELDRQAEPLLEQLRALQGCTYEPRIRFSQTGALGVREVTNAQRKRQEATRVEQQADELERLAAEGAADRVAARVAQIAAQARTPEAVAA